MVSETDAWVDIRGNLVSADFSSDTGDWLWALRTGAHACRRLLDLAIAWIDIGVDINRARLVSRDRVLWSHWRFENGDASWGTLASVGPHCQTTTQYILIDDFSESMTLQGTTLVRATYGRLTSEPLVTVPPPLWPIGNPFDWSDHLYD